MELIDKVHKSLVFIAKGIVEKRKATEDVAQKKKNNYGKRNDEERKTWGYPYSPTLIRGMNQFLSCCIEAGCDPEDVLQYGDESNFLRHFCLKPIDCWFENWPSSWKEKNMETLEKQFFYYLDAFAEEEGENNYAETEDCVEFLDRQDKNLVDGVEEAIYFKKYLAPLNDHDYKIVRLFIIENPWLTEQEYRRVMYKYRNNDQLKAAIHNAYEEFTDTGIRCPYCGWPVDATGYENHLRNRHKYREKKEPVYDGNVGRTIYRLCRPLLIYIKIPGELEIEIYNFCKSLNLECELWPYHDLYDIEIKFDDGKIWNIDAKTNKDPHSLKGKIENEGGFPARNLSLPNFEKGFYVIPTELQTNRTNGVQRNYCHIVNQALKRQKNIECVTLFKLKQQINEKVNNHE